MDAKLTESEEQFEKELIEALSHGAITDTDPSAVPANTFCRTRNWTYEPKIKTENHLWENFKIILEQHNQHVLEQPLSHSEFEQVKKQIKDLNTPFKAGQFLYGLNGVSQVEVDLDDGRHVFLTVFDQSQIGAGNTVYQVVNQIQRPAVITGRQDRRFDVTLLINGLPIVQIELKKDSGSVEDALNQMHQYIVENQYSGIFSTLQLLVAMTPYDSKYMACTTEEGFNKDFSFHWQNRTDNKIVRSWKTFADEVLSIPAAHNLSTNYMILDGTPNKESLKVMRPYQVYATENALEAIRTHDPDDRTSRLGYIWHTTGSGKTITSFKTAWLASRMPGVDKVVFVVDRRTLTGQTLDKYRAYDPEASGDSAEFDTSIADTKNTWELARKLKANNQDIIITSFQKLLKLVRGKFKVPEKKYLFIVDEAHRSTGGEGFKEIQEAFPHSAWLGYSGTPIFETSSGKSLTVDIFGRCLHAYTIREAIADKNVLGFNVDFKTTIPKDEAREHYLPAFYKAEHPDWTEEDIQYKIEHLGDEDIDDEVSSFYDNNPKHVEAVVKDIYENWDNRSVNGKYNALLTTHTGGKGSSTPMAMMYFREFQKVNKEREEKGLKPLKVAVTFSSDNTNGNNMVDTNNGLDEAIKVYNKQFGTSFGLATVDEYKSDVETRLNRTNTDGNYLDLVIVVDQLLTGFDAPQLNTLYVDRILKGPGLVQAYSRTNRIDNMQDKPFGHVVNYRWPDRNEQMMNEALTMYANGHYSEMDPTGEPGTLIDPPADILAPPFRVTLAKTKKLVEKLREMTDGFVQLPKSEKKQLEMLEFVREYNASISKLKQYSIDEIKKDIPIPDEADGFKDMSDSKQSIARIIYGLGMSEADIQALEGPLINELKKSISDTKKILPSQIDLTVIHLKEVTINYDYLTELLEDLLNKVHEQKMDEAAEIKGRIDEFANGIDNRLEAKAITKAADAIIAGDFPPEDSELRYPYKLHNSQEIVQQAHSASMNRTTDRFIKDWGLQNAISPEQMRSFLLNHHYGKNDLDDQGKISDLLSAGASQYRECAENAQIRELKIKVRYRNQLRRALYALADDLVSE